MVTCIILIDIGEYRNHFKGFYEKFGKLSILNNLNNSFVLKCHLFKRFLGSNQRQKIKGQLFLKIHGSSPPLS